MPQLQVASDFLFVGRGEESFLENYSYEQEGDVEGAAGKVFIALEILNNQAEAEDIGEAIFANFKQKFYENPEDNPYNRFEYALKEVNRVLEEFKSEKVSRFIGNLNILIGTVCGAELLLSAAGDSEAYLIRRRYVSIVSEGLVEDIGSSDAFLNIASGTLEKGDMVIFSSSRLLRYITKADLGKIFSSGKDGLTGSLSNLQDFITTELLGRVAVIGLEISSGEISESSEEKRPVYAPETRGRKHGITLPLISQIKLPSWVNLELPPWMKKWRFPKRIKEKLQSLLPKNLPRFPRTKPVSRFSLGTFTFTKERILIAIIVVMVLLLGGIYWAKTRGNQNEMVREQLARLTRVRDIIHEAETTGQFDKEKAAVLLQSAEKEALDILNSRTPGSRNETVKVLDDIQKKRDFLDNVRRIQNPEVVVDLSTKRSNVSTLGLTFLKDRLYAFEYNALYEILLKKLQDPLTVSDTETVILGTNFPEDKSLLFLTRSGKLIEYRDGRFGFADTKEGVWKKGVDMKTYGTRLYLLDPERNQIWRYTKRKDGFDASEPYNRDADVKLGVSLAIDASVYVLMNDGKIVQLYTGAKQDYPLRRQPLVPLRSPTKIYTEADMNQLFVLDPGNQRIVAYTKDPKNGGANYSMQFVFENTGTLRDLYVSKDENKLYVIDESKIYNVSLATQ